MGIFNFNSHASAAEQKVNQNENHHIIVNEKLNARIVSISKVADVSIPTPMYHTYPGISLLGAGEWDFLGTSTFKTRSKIFYSGGGDLKIYITQPYSSTWSYKLYEDDPIYDDLVSEFKLYSSGTYAVTFDVRNYPDSDGVSGKAELYLSKLTNPLDSVTTEWWD